jgi:Arc/MetJ-type ribon-helix-helix transcriptional regulator
MARNPCAVSRREAEAEKVTINVGYVDLGHIDLLVQESCYANRSDFIRTAIRNQIHQHRDLLKDLLVRRPVVLGLQRYSRQDLERAVANGELLAIRVLGLVAIDDDVPPQLAAQAFVSISVLGALHATPEVRAALADRMRL